MIMTRIENTTEALYGEYKRLRTAMLNCGIYELNRFHRLHCQYRDTEDELRRRGFISKGGE